MQFCAYMETVKERTVDLAYRLAESDVNWHRAEEARDAATAELAESKRDLAVERAENVRLKGAADDWQAEKRRMEDEAKAREDRVDELKRALERAREMKARWKSGYEQVRSLAAGAVRLYQKSESFKETVGLYCLQSYTEGALALKDFLDAKHPGLDYTGAECLDPAPPVAIPEMEDDDMLRMLDAVFEGSEPSASPDAAGVPTTPGDGATSSAPVPPDPVASPGSPPGEAEADRVGSRGTSAP